VQAKHQAKHNATPDQIKSTLVGFSAAPLGVESGYSLKPPE